MDDHLPGLSGMKRSKIAQMRANPRHATEIHLQPTNAPTISTYRTPIVTKTYNEFHGFTVCARSSGLHKQKNRSANFFSLLLLCLNRISWYFTKKLRAEPICRCVFFTLKNQGSDQGGVMIIFESILTTFVASTIGKFCLPKLVKQLRF